MNIEIGNRVFTEVRGEYKSVCTLAASKRVARASDKYRCSLVSDQNIIACTVIENGIVPFRAVDRYACTSSKIGLLCINATQEASDYQYSSFPCVRIDFASGIGQ
jgi:hypothetical protein